MNKNKHKNKDDNNKSTEHGKQTRLQSDKQPKINNKNSFISTKAKRDIIGVSFIIIGIIIFVIAIVPGSAPLTVLINTIFRFCFGQGIFVLPFVPILIGISFFLHMEKQNLTLRVAIGMSLIFVSVLGLISLTSPAVNSLRYEDLFTEYTIYNFGGIIGSSLAWVFASLLGPEISAIIFIGIALAGLIVVGFSISGLIKRLIQKRDDIDNLQGFKQKDQPFFNKSIKNNRNYGANIPTNALFDNKGNVIIDEKGSVVTVNHGEISNTPTRSIDPSFIDEQGQVIDEESLNLSNKKTKRFNFLKFLKTNNNNLNNAKDEFNFNANQKETKILPDNNNDNENIQNSNKTLSNKQDNIKSARKKTEKISCPVNVAAMPKPQAGFELPPMEYLEDPAKTTIQISKSELQEVANNLQTTLSDFGIKASVVGWVAGPTVTLYKIDLPSGIRVSRITALNDDIALALAAPGVRVFAPIPGTTYVGIEVPNTTRQTVFLKEVLLNANRGPLQIAIGKDVEGHSIVSDLAKMPHLLIGGTTGSGKSVLINAMIMSILMRSTPSEVKFILIDPKRVEFMPYNGIPHLYVPVVTEPKEAASALSWGVAEMERRLKLFAENGVRNIGTYNAKVQKTCKENVNKSINDKNINNEDDATLEELPYIVIVIDELADLMMALGKEVEFSISRIAQLARAAGIHLIVATQRPSTNVVTGLIKANITNRIAFNVASGIDSRVILDTGGAENLIGLGDLLFSKPEYSKPLRIQGCYLSENEVNQVVDHLKGQAKPEYHNDILKTNLVTIGDSDPNGGPSNQSNSDDSLFWSAAEMVVNTGSGSTSSLQRRFKIGYARAGRIMDRLEELEIVGPQCGSKPREVLYSPEDLEALKVSQIDDDIMQDS